MQSFNKFSLQLLFRWNHLKAFSETQRMNFQLPVHSLFLFLLLLQNMQYCTFFSYFARFLLLRNPISFAPNYVRFQWRFVRLQVHLQKSAFKHKFQLAGIGLFIIYQTVSVKEGNSLLRKFELIVE